MTIARDLASVLAVIGATATPAAAQMQPAPPADLVAATRDCIAATGPTGFDAAALSAAGWSVGTAADAKGKPIVSPVRFFGKKDSKAMILHTAGAKSDQLCVVMGRVDDPAAPSAIIAGLDAALATRHQVTPKEPTAAYWFPSGRLVQLQQTGSAAAPSLRIAVMFMAQEKK